VKPAQWTLLVAVLAAVATQSCGRSTTPPQDPSGAKSNPAAGDPGAGLGDLGTASSKTGDTPINSGAGDAAPEHTH
jgi:hypothetical protein